MRSPEVPHAPEAAAAPPAALPAAAPELVVADLYAALAAARRKEPQLIISDIEMPGQSGLDLLRELRADRSLRRVPVIVVSGFGSRAHVRTGMGLGADDYIPKPFTREELVKALDQEQLLARPRCRN